MTARKTPAGPPAKKSTKAPSSKTNRRMPPGQRTLYTQELAARLCELVADGIALSAVCKNPDMPSYAAVKKWMRSRPEFAGAYLRAKQFHADFVFEDILSIADGVKNSKDANQINAARLRIDSRKWYLGRLSPKKYGDRVVQEQVFPEGLPVQRTETITYDGGPIDPATAAERYKQLMG